MIADHHIGFTPVEVPYGQASVLFKEGDEGFYHVVDTFRFGICKKGMGGTVGIPKGESAVIHPAVTLMYFFVGTVIGSVYVTVNRRCDHRVVQSCIKVYFIILIVTLDFDLSQLAVPVCFCFCQILVEVIFGHFGLQVLGCAFHADAGNGGIDENLFSFFGMEVKTCDDSRTDVLLVFDNGSRIQFHLVERLGEAGAEVDSLVACPAVGVTVSLNRHRVHYFDVRIVCEVPVHGFLQIQEDGGFGFGEGVSLDATTFGCGQFHIDMVVFQTYLIVACIGALFIVRKLGVDAQRRFCLFVGQCDRHERDVVQVACTCSRKVGMAEAGDGAVRIKIAGDAVPSRKSVVRAELHHTEGGLCAGISVSCEIGANKRIYIRCVINFSFCLFGVAGCKNTND